MKRCLEEAQEKCPWYEAKNNKVGKVDLTCLYWRKEFGGIEDYCDAPPPKKSKKGG